ncbi:tRNA lysidine(34) synthetase TilS [Sphingomonas sp. MAH-20]|uniref:tRNA(Ile)-lysidine synthase n=1 Tax=Sphingomonas horti TaxID=2682842 RepID=A0A6I4J461_9SPHN|nr:MULTISPECIES: tRNA lysidine(34) synthetase TilS [Sphingomonas]MBA2919202.1 tRNA lysidine(34) synthetase TilS [Sphingomonas sp. CGMCC 1.13658]MVO79235.1 tRNA lysidine(34) synthetase TilS [Sphingomonas horti]
MTGPGPLFDAIPAGDTIGLAVSGGPDSLALLLLGAAERPGRVRAATVDHQLRPESRAEAEAVGALCAERGVPHDVLTVSVEGSVQAAAREARYAALGEWCAAHGLTHLATGHHVDDQAETLLMRLARGAGLSGLAGIRAARPLCPGVTLVRPLLGARKAELEAIVAAAGIAPARDPSNADPRYDRTAARALLAGAAWLDPARLAHSAAHLAESDAALEWATDRAWAERFDGASLDPAGLPPELLRRLVLRIFASHGEVPRGADLARLIASLQAGRAATLGTLKAGPGTRWTFAPAPPRRPR